LDFESTGLDVARDRIVEIGAAAANGDFSTVVSPGIPSTSAVHGIEEEEIAQGPVFPMAWVRFVAFVEGLVNAAVHENSDDDSEDDSPRLPRPPDEPPVALLAAHNGERFDYALLLCECSRYGLSWAPLERWRFVDTLSVLHVVGSVEIGGCFKLQCMVRSLGSTDGLQAHRALDDCFCLRGVMEYAAARLGISILELLKPFAVRLDADVSAAQVSVLLESSSP